MRNQLPTFILTKTAVNLEGGIVVANPIPYEHALSKAYIEAIINEAVVEAENQKVLKVRMLQLLLLRENCKKKRMVKV